MSDDNPALTPRSLLRPLIQAHTDQASAMQQQDLQLWPHVSMSQPQAAGVQAVPVGIGYSSRPQQQIWPDHSSAFSQRGWQPFPQAHAQQSPQDSQELNPQVVRSPQQNWPGGEINQQLQLQQLQQLIWLQQQQQQQQQQLQMQQQHQQAEATIHHLDPIGHGHREEHEKFTKSPSPQIEENRNSPAVGRPFMHNVTSPQQQLWQHPQMMHQYDLSHGEPQHSQPFQQTPAVSHQPLFAQQQYVQPAVWQHHSPYSQVQMQPIRQSTPQAIQQHVLWHQQQQQQLQQHQLQQQQHQQQQQQHQQQPFLEPPAPYSPSVSNFLEKSPIKKDYDARNESVSLFNNSRLPTEPVINRSDTLPKVETSVTTINTVGIAPAPAPPLSLTDSKPLTEPTKQIRILSKTNQTIEEKSAFSPTSPRPPESNFQTVTTTTHTPIQRPIQGTVTNSNVVKPQNFNPNPNVSPYQNLNPQQLMSRNIPGMYGSQTSPRFPSPVKDAGFVQPPNVHQFRPRSPGGLVRNPVPNAAAVNSIFQKNTHGPVSNVHHVENVEVHLFVQNLNPRTRAESIQNYFEAIAKPATVKDGILFNLEHTEALVIFQQKPDMIKLKQTVRARKLDGFTLEICEMPPPRAIVITADGSIKSRADLVSYFQRESVGGGPVKKNGEEETEDGCCLIEFEDHRVVQRLCFGNRSHRVDQVLLKVSPYYQCENGAIWDMNMHVVPVPKPVKIQILPDQLEFVKKHCQPQFTARLHDKYAEVTFFKDHVMVKPLLHHGMRNYRTLVRGWETGIQEAVAKFLAEHIDQADVGVPEQIWDKLMEFLNSGKPEFKELLIKPDRERKTIKLVGSKGVVKVAQNTLLEKIELLSREARRKTETRKVKSAEKLTVLEIQGTFSDLCKKYGDMKIHVDGNEVTVEGDPAEIASAFIEMYSECDKIEPVEYKHTKNREWVNLMKKDVALKYVQAKLDKKKLRGSWEVTGTALNVYVPEKDKANSEKIRDTVLAAILEETVPVEKSSTELLNSEVWGDFLADNRRKFRDKVEVYTKKQQVVVIVGTDDVVPHVTKLIQEFLDSKTVKTIMVQCDPVVCEFICECWTQDDFTEIQKNDVAIKTKTNGVELTGLSDNLIKGKQKLDMKLKRMCSKKHVIKKTGVHGVLETMKHCGTISGIEKECKCVIKLPKEIDESPSAMLSDYEVIEADISEEVQHAPGSNSAHKCFQTRRHKIKVHLGMGEIGHQKADVIVAGTASNLNLRSGSTSYSLLKQGGPQLQTDCNRLYPNGIEDGEVAVIDSGNLSCDKVYLTSLPSWKDAGCNGGKVFRNFLRECLRLADRSGKRSIAFSSVGTSGYLSYPKDVVASIMYGAVVEFDSSYGETSLRDIYMVISGKETDTLKAFEEHEHVRQHGAASVGPLSSDFAGGRFKIDLVTEDLSIQKVDAILCSVSSDMNLTRNVMCKSLVQHGGNTLQDECKQKYNNELDVGKVAEISGGKLPCKTVFLTVLPTYTETNSAEKSLISTLQSVFQLANTKGYKSLAIPALGTGHLNYPKTTAAACMYDAALDWVTKNPRACLNMIRFVMYSKDTEAQQVYRLCHLKSEGRDARCSREFLGDGTIVIKPEDNPKNRMIRDGCMIGPIKLLVHVGDILENSADALVNVVGANFDMKGVVSQALVKKCPNILPECQQKKAELKKTGVVTTVSAGLTAKHVIHVQLQESLASWRSKIVLCLEEANKKGLKSLAIPVLGSGVGGKSFPPDGIADYLYATIDDFTSEVLKSSVTEVRLIVTEDSKAWKPKILSALQDRMTSLNSQAGINRILRSKTGFVVEKPVAGKQDSGKGTTSKTPAKDASVMVVVHSDAIINIDRCIKALDDRIGLDYASKVVDADTEVVEKLPEKQVENMVDAEIAVDVKFDKKTSKFTLSGPTRNILSAITCLCHKVNQFKHEEHTRTAAECLYNNIRWHWLFEEITQPDRELPYGTMPNYVIETAYKEGKQTVELQARDSRIYVLDFDKLVEFSRTNSSDQVKVIRKDVLKGLSVPIPANWMSMSNNENVKRVTLTSGPEYQKVEKHFLGEVRNGLFASKVKNSRAVQVLKIERIQNRSLFQQFAARRKVMETQKTGCKQLDRQVWHSTEEQNIPHIVNNGFNRSYCGKHGVLYGQGVYFAADASYAVQSSLAGGYKPGTKRYMFLVKALTGDLIKGNPAMRVLPPVNPAQPLVLYDSAVDDVNNPMEFVLFHDTQAYPDYLITYSS